MDLSIKKVLKLLINSILGAFILFLLISYLPNVSKSSEAETRITENQVDKHPAPNYQSLNKDIEEDQIVVDEGLYARNKEDVEDLLSDNKPSMLVYGSKDCSACTELKKNIDYLYSTNDDVSIKYIEVTENPELIELYKIQQTPSVLLFDKKGRPFRAKRSDRKILDLHYEKGKEDSDNYTVFLGLPKMKRLNYFIDIAK